jgi:glyoxylase-like metal-dependent hydrolase (beta-lactamase superfamily II)
MRVLPLKKNERIYTCNEYLVRGDWNRLEDVNTLVDVGSVAFVMGEVTGVSTGFGKLAVDQVVLTHGHFDHAEGVAAVKAETGARVLAGAPAAGVDAVLADGDRVRLGDQLFEVICTPGHSDDSICLYCEAEGVLFSGDTPVRVLSSGGSYSDGFVAALEKLARRQIRVIYPGHGEPITSRASGLLAMTLEHVRASARPSVGGAAVLAPQQTVV